MRVCEQNQTVTVPHANRRLLVKRFWESFANICYEYATKRYRSNCINWGILPFTIDGPELNSTMNPATVFSCPVSVRRLKTAQKTFPQKS